jgi:DNA-binding LacI/PurR family transcriptional regulator
MLVLLDSDDEGGRAASRAKTDLFGGDDSRILMLGQHLGREYATIEDLVPREQYLAALKEAGHEIALTPEEHVMPTVVGALEKAFQRLGRGKFTTEHKAAAALRLMDRWNREPASIDASTRTMVVALFTAMNQRFETGTSSTLPTSPAQTAQ